MKNYKMKNTDYNPDVFRFAIDAVTYFSFYNFSFFIYFYLLLFNPTVLLNTSFSGVESGSTL